MQTMFLSIGLLDICHHIPFGQMWYNMADNLSWVTYSDRPAVEDREVLWEKRHYLFHMPQALPKVLLAAHSWDWACLDDLHTMLHMWSPMEPVSAMQLLLPW
jgi:phosphatidylinositol-4-phosphate 3-kinase